MYRFFVLGAAAASAALSVISCSGSAPAPAATTFSAACLHYASHVTGGQCGAPALPAAEVERVTPRWAQHCEDVLAMHGSSLTAAALDQCLTLLETGDCWSANPPDSCLSAGTLAANAPCNQFGVQCQSGACLGIAGQAPCGTCIPAATLGQPCDPMQSANVCVLGTSCVTSTTGTSICTAVTLAAAGAACVVSSDCATGLVCDPVAQMCVKPPGVGASCSDPLSCAYPLVCNVTATGSTTCQDAGTAGAPCLSQFGDEYCAKGLGCSQGGSTCGVITWQAVGQPCDGDLTRCLVGSCPPDQVPVCPIVLKDGDACSADDTAHTCDVGALCTGGKCVPGSSVVCQ